MKRFLVVLVICIFVEGLVISQEFSKEFGQIGEAEINLTKYARDPEAEAVILFDIGESKFIESNNGYDIEFTRTKRIKILTRAGVKYSEISIPYYIDASGQAETVKAIVAISYNYENGQQLSSVLNPANVYDEKINNRWSVKKFVFPDVKPGTIIEYQYLLNTPFLFNLPDWEFQSRIPTVFSKYTARTIPFYEYAFLLQGANRFDIRTSVKDSNVRTYGSIQSVGGRDVGNGIRFNDMIYVYALKDVPAFKDESYITSVEDNLIKLDFQLAKVYYPYGGINEIMSTWPKLIQDLLRHESFGKYLNSCEKASTAILDKELNLEGKDDLQKCQAIIDYVKSTFAWDGYYSIYSSKNTRNFLNQKNGNSTDINLFLTALLKSAGINAVPILISTRDHGRIRAGYPFLHFFNNVIVLVKINDKSFFCDGTEPLTPFNLIPPRCLNDRGLVIESNGENWVDLNLNYNSVDDKALTFEILPAEARMKVKMVLQSTEYDSYWYKKNMSDDSAKISQHFIKAGISEVTRVNTFNYDNHEKTYIINCEGETEIERLNENLVISPFLNLYPHENRLTQPSRSYPIDFTYANTEKFSCRFKVPEGYKIVTIPENYNMENEQALVKVNYTVKEDLIEIEGAYRFKKPVYMPTEYGSIKTYYDMIVKKFSEQIVISKI